ncbi:hypothetical protein LSAT2_003957 [Lamellibrachia satsuma]|nr:hypothetical protein LSAT2_003957 [Lamellibrachia satsuma]
MQTLGEKGGRRWVKRRQTLGEKGGRRWVRKEAEEECGTTLKTQQPGDISTLKFSLRGCQENETQGDVSLTMEPVLRDRTWTNIRDFCRNCILSATK